MVFVVYFCIACFHVVYLNQPEEIHVQRIRTLENPLALKKSTFNMLCACKKLCHILELIIDICYLYMWNYTNKYHLCKVPIIRCFITIYMKTPFPSSLFQGLTRGIKEEQNVEAIQGNKDRLQYFGAIWFCLSYFQIILLNKI